MSTIVIVGADLPLTREVMSIIQKDGHTLLSASDIKDGIEISKNLPFDTLLLVKNKLRSGHVTDFVKRMREEKIVHPVLVFFDLLPTQNNISVCTDLAQMMPYGEIRTPLFRAQFDKTLLKAIKAFLPVKKAEFFDREQLLPRKSPAAVQMRAQISMLAALDCNTLILGESGLCKPTVAFVMHNLSCRKGQPFVEVGHCDYSVAGCKVEPCKHCKLTEGYVKSHNGTLYMRNLHGFCQFGLNGLKNLIREGKYNVRIISSAVPSIHEKVADGLFDGALFQRLSTLKLNLFPIRELQEDIPTLADHFLGEFAELSGNKKCKLTAKAMKVVMCYPFPNNVLEFKTLMFQCAALNVTGKISEAEVLAMLPKHTKQSSLSPKEQEDKQWFIDHFSNGGTVQEAADYHKVHPRTIYYRLDKFGIKRKGSKICAVI